ncbi:hypothetical protein JHK82_026035 [Glycine max]|nr:hypothetical protein JHK85_026644 [Glycine max]KAG5013901.1 hypothetical protein JHK86_026162 [Glycine max]KAG5134847.1 hypothetical protein JHK82_026035 [Glycine max]KHN11586.1 Putative pectate lyase 3 [Glycine soja]
MARSANKVTFIFLVAFAITIPCLEAGIAEFDDFLKAQASEAQVIALKSYQPDPINVTAEFNIHVHRALMEEENDTRRELKQKYHGPCMATNPIDSCWRCRKHWAQDRFRYGVLRLFQVMLFGASDTYAANLVRGSSENATMQIGHYASPEVWSKWQWKSENDLFINGATFLQSGAPLGKLPFNKGLMMKPRPGAEASRLTRFAGTLNCKLGKPC